MELTLDTVDLRRAIALGPQALARHMDRGIDRVVRDWARDARLNSPESFGELRNSISFRRPSALEGITFVGVDYGPMVEQGTGVYGPEGLPSEILPPVENILDWVKKSGITPRNPGDDQVDVAFAIAQSIAQGGTPAQPFLGPAFDDNRAAAERRLNAAIDAALAEIDAA